MKNFSRCYLRFQSVIWMQEHEYLLQIFNNPFPNIRYNFTSTKEIKNVIKSLKTTYSNGYNEISV
jgi:hypothetical protein